jgi:hypothetical protein
MLCWDDEMYSQLRTGCVAGWGIVARIDLVTEYPGGWLSDVLGVPAVYSGHKLFCVGCTI